MTAYTYERSLRSVNFSKTRTNWQSYKEILRTISTIVVLGTLAVGAVALKVAIWLPTFTHIQ